MQTFPIKWFKKELIKITGKSLRREYWRGDDRKGEEKREVRRGDGMKGEGRRWAGAYIRGHAPLANSVTPPPPPPPPKENLCPWLKNKASRGRAPIPPPATILYTPLERIGEEGREGRREEKRIQSQNYDRYGQLIEISARRALVNVSTFPKIREISPNFWFIKDIFGKFKQFQEI